MDLLARAKMIAREKRVKEGEARFSASLKEINKTKCLSPLGPVVWMVRPEEPDGKLGDVYWRKSKFWDVDQWTVSTSITAQRTG